jgi:hypothetical protein
MWGSDQATIAAYVARHYNALAVARSIATHGYFQSEPLMVIEEGENLVVVEGNRRLVALLGLASTEFRAVLDRAAEWSRLAGAARLPESFPVIRAANRLDVAPLIGGGGSTGRFHRRSPRSGARRHGSLDTPGGQVRGRHQDAELPVSNP